jgi:DnaJ-class molecular chaperone
MKAQLCPVCNGGGKYTPLLPPSSNATPAPETCHGCHGKGWVVVPEDYRISYDYEWSTRPYFGITGSGWFDRYGQWHQGY